MSEKAFSPARSETTRRAAVPVGADERTLLIWQAEARTRLAGLLGLGVEPPATTRVETEVTADPGGDPQLVRLMVDEEPVPAWLLRPEASIDRRQAVVALAGHGRGIDALVDPGSAADDYHGGVARKLQTAGFTVLCPELISFGRRRTADGSEAASSCQVDAMRGLLSGRPVLGRRVHDALAAVEVARSLPGVDPSGVAVLGGSGGGAVALLVAALDQQVPAAVVATFISSLAGSFCSVPHCICNAVPNLLTWFEMADLAALIAPRELIIEAGEADPIFPVDATLQTYAELAPVWAAFRTPPPQLIITPAAHQFLADQAIAALVAALTPVLTTDDLPPHPRDEGVRT